MTRKIILAAALLTGMAGLLDGRAAEAQTLSIGRSGVHYSAYGQGQYYDSGHNHHGYGYRYQNGYRPGPTLYSPYGNGPYGYRTGPSYYDSRGAYRYGTTTYYNAYGDRVSPNPTYGPRYLPYGYGNSFQAW